MNVLSTAVAAIAGFIVTGMLGLIFIPMLKKLKFGQTINDEGPSWHKNKSGTPTMGGIIFIIGIIVAVLIGYLTLAFSRVVINEREISKIVYGLIMAFGFGLIGFIDDYIKVVKKRNLGLTAIQKIVMQVVVTVVFLFLMYISGDKSTILIIPFIGQLDLGFLYFPLMGMMIIFIVNAANLTDGVDGLLGSVTFVIAIAFMAMTSIMHLAGMNIVATALAGGCLGFLMWNFHPAKVFMGDTGSMFLGGMVIALSFGIDMPIILFLVGFIYCVEAFSVILQVISFKTTGKRIFKMSPIHHHFEMCGYSENKIVLLFSLVTIITCIIAVISVALS
ncbi:MAG: phospho-N-acetylmuramoyl-pentapeptide-transferase [Oscillospiraceae bacterium]